MWSASSSDIESQIDSPFRGKLLERILKSKEGISTSHSCCLKLESWVLNAILSIDSKAWHIQWEGRHGKARTMACPLSESVGGNALFIDQFIDPLKQPNISNGCYASLQSFIFTDSLNLLIIRESLYQNFATCYLAF